MTFGELARLTALASGNVPFVILKMTVIKIVLTASAQTRVEILPGSQEDVRMQIARYALMNKLDKVTLAGLGEVRNTHLTVILDLAQIITECLNSGEIPEERRQILVRTFCDLLCCSKSKLRFPANVGFLVILCPWLKHLQQERGWGDMWCNLSKFATAIGYH